MDKLFLLKPGFTDSTINQNGQLFYCPESAFIEGLLTYYPSLKYKLEIIYVDFPRPRKTLVDLLGTDNQGCPVLVVDGEAKGTDFKVSNGRSFLNTPNAIALYLSQKHNIALPHP